MVTLAPIDAGPLHRFTRADYDLMVAAGVFEDRRVELLYGVVVEMSPQNDPHARCVNALLEVLVEELHRRARVRGQAPFAASDGSEPEPDVLVCAREHVGHPSTAFLVIEVSDTSLRRDLGVKAGLYAECGVPEYWVFDVLRREVHVHTGPRDDGSWRSVIVEDAGAVLVVGAFPDVRVSVAEVFAG